MTGGGGADSRIRLRFLQGSFQLEREKDTDTEETFAKRVRRIILREGRGRKENKQPLWGRGTPSWSFLEKSAEKKGKYAPGEKPSSGRN